jgi:hypothetical protein
MKIDVHVVETLYDVIEHVVAGLETEKIKEFAGSLPEHSEEAANKFCERFELGNWFYEAMTLNSVQIGQVLDDIVAQFEEQERIGSQDRAELQRDYHASLGV